jgi:hypothetical protein
MSAQTTLLELYQDWRTWTETEREAISDGDWRRVKTCQSAKSELQPRILRQTEQAQIEWLQLGIDRKSMEKQLRSVVNELIYLESRNAEFIADQRATAQEEFNRLDGSRRNLSKIQKHYAGEHAVGWESYS